MFERFGYAVSGPITQEMMLELATDNSDYFRRQQAEQVLDWMVENDVTEPKRFVGPFGKLQVRRGNIVVIRKGTVIQTLHPAKPREISAGRTYKVKVDHVFNGWINEDYDHSNDRRIVRLHNPRIEWAGQGGYWCSVDANDVEEA
jgi:hypothetical protein